MTSVHPEFDSNTSRCVNCAAFVRTHATSGHAGECRRHAPTPRPAWVTIKDANEEDQAHHDASEETAWPQTETYGDIDEAFCCEWLPKTPKPVSPAVKPQAVAEWPTWDELLERPELCVKNVGVRLKNAIASELDDKPNISVHTQVGLGELRFWRNCGPTCLDLARSAVDGWRRDKAKSAASALVGSNPARLASSLDAGQGDVERIAESDQRAPLGLPNEPVEEPRDGLRAQLGVDAPSGESPLGDGC